MNTTTHEACSYCYIVVRCDGKTKPPVDYRGSNAAEQMLRSLMNEQDQILKTLANPKPMKISQKDQLDYANAKDCHICDKSLIIPEFHAAKDLYDPNTGKHIGQVHRKCLFEELAEFMGPIVKPRGNTIKQENCLRCKETLTKKFYKDSVRDHCHITGQYRGAAHNACNLKLKICPRITQIPVVFHNLRGYDSHLIMQAISKIQETNEDEDYLKLSCIPNNTEKYISFNLGNLRFIDSVQFLLTSLDRLVAANRPETFQITAQYEPDEKKRNLLMRKGIYPYEYMDSWNRFNETNLPLKERFFNKLSDSGIIDEDYSHAVNVWETFSCRNIGEHCDLYCRTDVLLLADVFENFRNTCSKQYKLDPAHYYSSPGMSWDALLRITGVELELLTDYDQHLFIEKGIRGGISMVSKRYAKANNPQMEGYDPEKQKSYLLYLDANNLYGWAMSQPLPTGGFQWEKDCKRLQKTIVDHPSDSDHGYIHEVDLEYPEELHETHNGYPLVPEKLNVKEEWLSNYQKSVKYLNTPEVEKLVPNLRKKEKYIIRYRNL